MATGRQTTARNRRSRSKNRVTRTQRQSSAVDDPPEADSLSLARQLLSECRDSNLPVRCQRADGSQVLLDLEVDGVRCVVSQMPEQAESERIELTPREQEVARMVARGFPNKSIAAVLEISPWTVGTYLRRVFAKMNVNSRAAMVSILVEQQLLD